MNASTCSISTSPTNCPCCLKGSKDHFCLTNQVPKEEDSQWISKRRKRTRADSERWKKEMTHTIHTALVQSPGHKMRQSQIFKLCKPALDEEGLATNNFYRLAASIPWIIIEKEGSNVILSLNETADTTEG